MKKKYIDEDVHTAALKRIKDAIMRYDDFYVSFSGGKDSTVVLELVIEVAREMDKLPVKVLFRDEECIPPIAIDFVHEVAKREEVDMRWYAVPLSNQLSTTDESDSWISWDEECPEMWVRPKPDQEYVISSIEGYGNHNVRSQHDFDEVVMRGEKKTICAFLGVRAEESMQRLMSMLQKSKDNYISNSCVRNLELVKPIYDWKTKDIWLAIHKFDWPVNPVYKLEELAGLKIGSQRLATPLHSQGLGSLSWWRSLFPEFFDKMMARFPGVYSAMKYSNTSLYGRGKKEAYKLPRDFTSWGAYVKSLLKSRNKKDRKDLFRVINSVIKRHKTWTRQPIPDNKPHAKSQVSWQVIVGIVMKNDTKGRVLTSLVKPQ